MRWFVSLIFLLAIACHRNNETARQSNSKPSSSVGILVQPFGNFSPSHTTYIVSELKKFNLHVSLLKPVVLPNQAWYEPRRRYRADSLIHWLANMTKDHDVVIGLTSKDISTTKGSIKDWGIMGLGFKPGKACIASAFRLNKGSVREQLFKVVIHELGHMQGLDHCPEKTCFMRDAEGGNPTDDEKEFCEKCKNVLVEKGWTL